LAWVMLFLSIIMIQEEFFQGWPLIKTEDNWTTILTFFFKLRFDDFKMKFPIAAVPKPVYFRLFYRTLPIYKIYLGCLKCSNSRLLSITYSIVWQTCDLWDFILGFLGCEKPALSPTNLYPAEIICYCDITFISQDLEGPFSDTVF
jgi:hypothetical protein